MARVYLDSCVVIYLIEGPEPASRTISTALQPEEGVPSVIVSDLTRLECRVKPRRERNQELLRQFDEFFDSDDVEKIPLTSECFELATDLRARHGTKTPDALHLAAALLQGCSEFWTNDRRLGAAAGGRIELKIFPNSTL